MKTYSIEGKKFNRLLAIKFVKCDRNHRAIWIFRCDCGKEKQIRADVVKSGESKSCGCYSMEVAKKHVRDYLTKHGMYKSRVYSCWSCMMQRCKNPNQKHYANYGGRGIKVCREWHDASTFIKWALAHGYRDDLTLDRINNDGNYTPPNCRWSTRKEQAKNTRRNPGWFKRKKVAE